MTNYVSAILFDLDGTLVDSVELTVTCFTHACRTHLGTAPSRAWIASTMGRPLVEALEEAAPGRSAALLAAYQAHFDVHHDRLMRPYPAALALAHALHERGFPLGVVTSKRRAGAMRALDLYGLTPLLDVIITPEDTLRHKPSPDPLLEAARRLGLPPARVLYVGDSTHDLRAARAAGMPAAAVLWGAGVADDLQALEPELVLRAPGDLLDEVVSS